LLEKYGPLYPRLTTKSARHEEVDVKAVAFKAFKVAYDRESGYVGYKVNGDEFKLECTKFDKVLLVFKDGTYKVTELPENCSSGLNSFLRPARPRTGVHLRLHQPERQLSQRFTFGGTILDKAYSCIPEKSRILFSARNAQGPVCPLQTRTAPEGEPANLRPVGSGRESPRPWPANLVQGHLLSIRRAYARLGRKRDHDKNCVCLNQTARHHCQAHIQPARHDYCHRETLMRTA